jgi:hypothetical protein
MGWTSTIYFEDPARDDFQAILTQPIGASSAAGYVYGTGYTYYVEGVDNVGYGQPFTFDGSVTGEVRGATAGYSGLCEWFDKHTVEDCNLIEGTDTSTICQSGDSGGPTFVVNGNTGGVYAVGTIVGGASNDCFAETIGWEESASETALLLGT